MMERTWEYCEPGPQWEPIIVRMTDGEVLAFYWDWWRGEMRRKGKAGINPERCIRDWAVVYWAAEVGVSEIASTFALTS